MPTALSGGRTSGETSASSSTAGQPLSAPTRSAISTNAVAGSRLAPPMTWSASQGWVRIDSRPVNSSPPVPPSVVIAPSRGCPAARRPAEVTFGSGYSQ